MKSKFKVVRTSVAIKNRTALRWKIRLYYNVTQQFKPFTLLIFLRDLDNNSCPTYLHHYSNLNKLQVFIIIQASWDMLISTTAFVQVPAQSTSKIQEQQKYCVYSISSTDVQLSFTTYYNHPHHKVYFYNILCNQCLML